MSSPPPPAKHQTLREIGISVVVLGIAIAIFTGLYLTRPNPKRTEERREATLVEVTHVSPARHELSLEAYGRVVPAREVAVIPEVGGRVVFVDDRLMPGAHFKKGEVLLRVDPRNYRAALQQQSAAVQQAEVEREMERGRRVVAQQEWELFGQAGDAEGAGEPSRARALREPQLRSAEVAVQAAVSGLTKARLDLGRTAIRAPFDVMVLSESVDLGQVVGAGTTLANLVGTEAFWVEVSVPVWALPRIRIPTAGGGDSAAPAGSATIHLETPTSSREIQGTLRRLLGDLDPAGRLARVLVEIPDPLSMDEENSPPLLLGSYVRVDIAAGTSAPLFRIPRRSLRESSNVWLMDDMDRLENRQVTVVWREKESVLVSGLDESSRVITSRIPTAVNGLALRLPTEDASSSPAHEATLRTDSAPPQPADTP